MGDGWKVVEDTPTAAKGWKVVDETASEPPAPAAPAPDAWRMTDYGFRVQDAVTPDTGKPTYRREDGLLWYGPDQGNTGRPGWFDGKGVRGPNKPVENWISNTDPDRGLSIVDRLLNRQQERKRDGYFKTAMRQAGDASVVPTLPGLVRPIREALGYSQPFAVENWGMDPSAARVVKGTGDTVVAPVQLAANLAALSGNDWAGGIRDSVNQFVTDEKAFMDANFRQSQSGEMLGQALPFLLTGGATAAPQALGRGAAYAKAAGTGAGLSVALTPEANVQTPTDYWTRKGIEAGAGAALGVGGKAAGNLGKQGVDLTPEGVQKWFRSRAPKGEIPQVLQEDLAAQYAAARARGGAPFQALRANGQEFAPEAMQPYLASIDEAVAQVQNSGFSDKQTVINQLEKLKATAGEGPMNWGKALDIGTDLNDRISAASSGMNPDRNLARILKPIKEAHQTSLDMAGEGFGDAYKQAKQAWIEHVVPWEDPKQGARLLKTFINSPTPDKAMEALLRAKSEDQVGVFVSKLSKDKGLPALQAGLVESVIQQSLDESGRVVPAKFLGAMKARKDAYGLSFTGEAKWRMDGLERLLKDSKFAAQFLTGEWIRNLPGGRILPGSAYATPNAGTSLQKLFTSSAGQKLLYEASSLQPNSKAMGKLIEKDLPKIVSTGVRAIPENVMPFRPAATPAIPAAAEALPPDQNN